MESTIHYVSTDKRCSKCGGKFKIEKWSEDGVRYTNLFCEGYCFVKETKKVLKSDHKSGIWLNHHGKTYLKSDLMDGFREVEIVGVKHGIKLKTIGPVLSDEYFR